jgi:hypothetical protein
VFIHCSQIITLGKQGDRAAHARAAAFLLKPTLLPKLFGTFAERYANRPGGYTRIHKFGHRPGDNAPRAILELVDNARDLRCEMTIRAIGREVLKQRLKTSTPASIVNEGAEGIQEVLAQGTLNSGGYDGPLRPKTRWNLQKILKFRDRSTSTELSQKVGHYIVSCGFLYPSTLRTNGNV